MAEREHVLSADCWCHPIVEYYGMPPKSEAQRRMMGADLARARSGQKTRTGMNEKQLAEFATKPKGKKLPARKGK